MQGPTFEPWPKRTDSCPFFVARLALLGAVYTPVTTIELTQIAAGSSIIAYSDASPRAGTVLVYIFRGEPAIFRDKAFRGRA